MAHRAPWPHLCGLALLLELLQLLGREEAHGLVASNELGARRHGGEDDVAAQPTEAVDGKQDRALAPARIRPCPEGNRGDWGPGKAQRSGLKRKPADETTFVPPPLLPPTR